MRMTFDAAACASYIQLFPQVDNVADSCPLDCVVLGINDVIVDLDADGNVLGIEILGRQGDGPEPIMAAIADESIANALAAEGFEVPQLRGNPDIGIHRIG